LPTPNEFSDFRMSTDNRTNPQFSSDNKTVDQMVAETTQSESAFAELQLFLNNSVYTPGCRTGQPGHEPWRSPHPEKSGPGDGKTGI
jgi:hypothetical protein